ncbi:MAG: helix-turn-helix domain-containing protein [Solirubrobacteraceae bacterium]
MFAPTTAVEPPTLERDPWMTLEQAAQVAGVAPATVKTWSRPGRSRGRGDLPRLRVSRPARGVWRVRRSWLDAFLEECAPEPETEAPTEHRPPPAVIDGARELAARPRAPRRRRRPSATGYEANLPIIQPTR